MPLTTSCVCCVECCWKSRLTPAVCVLEGAATRRGGVLSCGDRTPPCRAVRSARIRAAYPGWTHGMLAHFMVRRYIAVVCKWQPTVLSYGEALADRVVSYRDISSDIVSYPSFSLMAVSCHHYFKTDKSSQSCAKIAWSCKNVKIAQKLHCTWSQFSGGSNYLTVWNITLFQCILSLSLFTDFTGFTDCCMQNCVIYVQILWWNGWRDMQPRCFQWG